MQSDEQHIDEEILVQKCIEDNRAYQEILYRRYAKRMFAVCKRYANDHDEAMDFLQEGFIQVFRSLDTFNFDGSLEGWIRRVIVYRTIDLLRKEKRYQEVVNSLDDELFVEPEEFELSLKTSNSERIRGLVNKLPGKAGLILKLHVLEGLTHPEIAEHLEITVGTSKSQLSRARRMLQSYLSNE